MQFLNKRWLARTARQAPCSVGTQGTATSSPVLSPPGTQSLVGEAHGPRLNCTASSTLLGVPASPAVLTPRPVQWLSWQCLFFKVFLPHLRAPGRGVGGGACFSISFFLGKIPVDENTWPGIWFVPAAAVLAINRHSICIFYSLPPSAHTSSLQGQLCRAQPSF